MKHISFKNKIFMEKVEVNQMESTLWSSQEQQ